MIILGSAPLIKWALILANRIVSWLGSGYFIKRAIRERRKRYVAAAVLISATMAGAMWLIFRLLRSRPVL